MPEFPTMTMAEFASAPVLPVAPLAAARAPQPLTETPPTAPRAERAGSDAQRDASRTPRSSPAPQPPPPPASPPASPPDRPCPQKKPRAWGAVFKRSASTLAAALSDRPAHRAPITTQSEFRRNFLKLHRDRVIRDTRGNCFRLHPIVMNGDCGFASIAKGINVARERVARAQPPADDRRSRRRFWGRAWAPTRPDEMKRPLQAKDIRHAMYTEIRKAKKTYLSDADGFGGVFSDEDFDKLERDVSRPGIAGHWLGTVLGVLEHVIVAHAMNINIFLYQFDLQRQSIRQFESATVDNPDCEVFLFFTGPAACGHFDTLVKISEPKARTFQA